MAIKASGVAIAVAALVVLAGGTAVSVYAASTNLNQTVSAGTISTFIGDTGGAVVPSPSVSFSAKNVSNQVQTSTGTLGTSTQRIYVDNPGGADNGWTVSLAATAGPTAKWTSGSDSYPFNAATSAGGQLTVDPSGATITAEVGATTGISVGSSSTFSSGSNTPVTLYQAGGTAPKISRTYLTGVALSQTIPASQVAGSYSISFTETVAAI